MLAQWEWVQDNPPLGVVTCEDVLEAIRVDAAANAVPRRAEDTDDVGQPGGGTAEAQGVCAAHVASKAVGPRPRSYVRAGGPGLGGQRMLHARCLGVEGYRPGT